MKTKKQDYEKEDSQGAGFATGLFIGAVIGAAAAFLFAPASGDQTRQHLKDLAEKQKESLKNQWDKTKDKAGEIVDRAQDKVDAAAYRANDSVDEYADKAVEKVIQVADGAKTTIDRFKRHDGHDDQA